MRKLVIVLVAILIAAVIAVTQIDASSIVL